MDGVICGHIHWPSDRVVDGVRYLNCGDWVDSCCGIVEHLDGHLEIVRWSALGATPQTAPSAEVVALPARARQKDDTPPVPVGRPRMRG
jgi:hypothetical protein